MQIVSTQTPDGLFTMAVDHESVVRLSGFGDRELLIKRLPPHILARSWEIITYHPYTDNVRAYYDGDVTALSHIPCSQTGPVFQERIWRAIRAIPFGQTLSYKQLADASGQPTAVRAAGTACGANRLILLVPCHRVLKSNGGIGSYLYGADLKASLLRHEGMLD